VSNKQKNEVTVSLLAGKPAPKNMLVDLARLERNYYECCPDLATGKVPATLNNQLGIAVANRTYQAYRELLCSPRWQRAFNAGARPQRLLWASTGTKDPKASDVLYIKALAAPFAVNTTLEATLLALADHGELGSIMSADGGDCEAVLAQFAKADIAVDTLATQLQADGAKSFVKSWNELLGVIASKSDALKQAA
jgi:transaldolase